MNSKVGKSGAIDMASMVVLLITVILFIVAIFVHGLGHELLLEGGVFLISIKLVLSSRKSELMSEAILDRLAKIEQQIKSEKRPGMT